MIDRLDRARWCAGILPCVACVLWLATAPTLAQGFSDLFGFNRTDSGPPPDAATTTPPAASEDATPEQPKAAPRRERRVVRSQPAKTPPHRSAWQAVKDGQAGSLGERINANTVTIVTGDLGSTDAALADDLSAVLDGEDLRILPVIGKGSAQNLRDVRFMKGVDIGFTQVNTLAHFKKTNQIGPIDDKIVYLAKLFNEEMHVIARTDGQVGALADLSGRRVNFGEAGSGTQLTARDLFARLGIAVTEVNLDQARALHELREGRIAASVVISGKPVSIVSGLSAKDGFRLLPVPYPKELRDDFLPSTVSAADYPDLVDQPVDTVAVGTVLIAYNWPKGSERYRRLEKFVAALFPRLAELQAPPRHPKWHESNLAAVLPGWQRFAAADEWLRRNREQAVGRSQLNAFFAAGDAGDRNAAGPQHSEQLFQEFLKWNRERRSP